MSPSPSAVKLILDVTTSYTVAQLDALQQSDLQASVASFITQVGTAAPNLQRRRLQTTGAGLESLDNWVANANWRIEYPRRIARVYWLPPSAVTLSDAIVLPDGGTTLVFNIAASFLPSGATPSGLKAYAVSVSTTIYSMILAIPVTAVAQRLSTEDVSPPAPPQAPKAPLSPPDVAVMSVMGMAPGAIVAIVLPIVACLLLAGAGIYWYRKRREKRVPMATVQPTQQQAVGGQLLVQPPDLPD